VFSVFGNWQTGKLARQPTVSFGRTQSGWPIPTWNRSRTSTAVHYLGCLVTDFRDFQKRNKNATAKAVAFLPARTGTASRKFQRNSMVS
jgi:hypothetical protein